MATALATSGAYRVRRANGAASFPSTTEAEGRSAIRLSSWSTSAKGCPPESPYPLLHFVLVVLRQALGALRQCVEALPNRVQPTFAQRASIEPEDIDGRAASGSQAVILPAGERKPEVLRRLVRRGIDEQGISGHISGKRATLGVGIAEGTGEQVVVPVEDPSWRMVQRLVMVDRGAKTFRAVHAALDAAGHGT